MANRSPSTTVRPGPTPADGDAPSVGNEMFLHNMRALWRRDPVLALRVDAIDEEERTELEPTRSGSWTARITTPGGPTYLHSRYDPEEEARRFAASVTMEEKYCFVVNGIGLGYHLRALYDRLRGDAFIICCEPTVALIATALTCIDLTDMIAAGDLILLTNADKARLHEQLQPHSALLMLGTRFVPHGPSMRADEAGHAEITKSITEFIAYTRMTMVTAVRNARITCKNIAMNLVTQVTTPPIDMLRNRFAGDPAIVISAGPSLGRNIDQLGDLKGRAVLCAVQTVLKPLARRGIEPDFVTSLDFHELSTRFFEGVSGLQNVHLVAEPKATWSVVDHYTGPISLLDNNWARLLAGEVMGPRGSLTAGATVAHLAFYLAVYMGCDPIIFVGQDLAFSGHVFYVPGVEAHQAWRSELNRFNTIEHREWDRIVRNRPILRRAPGNDGGELYTDDLLFTYLEQFEKDIAGVAARVINATEGGAKIRGTEVLTLREATQRHCRQPIDPARFAYRKSTKWRDPSRLGATREALKERIEELDGVIEVCDELLVLLKELRGFTNDPPRFNKRLIRVDELRSRIREESRAYQIVNGVTQLSELRRFTADRRLSAAETEPVERAKRQIQRDREFLTGVRDGAIDVKAILSEALERITNAQERA